MCLMKQKHGTIASQHLINNPIIVDSFEKIVKKKYKLFYPEVN